MPTAPSSLTHDEAPPVTTLTEKAVLFADILIGQFSPNPISPGQEDFNNLVEDEVAINTSRSASTTLRPVTLHEVQYIVNGL